MKRLTPNTLAGLAQGLLRMQPGFSFNIAGDVPQSGFMVSIAGYETITTNHSSHQISSFINRHQNTVAKKGLYFGGWIDEGKLYLDVSINVQDLQEAIELGILNRQKTIYNVNTGKIIKLPEPQRAGTLTQQRDYARVKAAEIAG